MRTFTVLKDTREKERKGWDFPAYKACAGTRVQKLATGDYCIEGLESVLVIERKGCASELVSNLFQDRFEREMERLEAFQLPFIICEFSLDEVWGHPFTSGVPRDQWDKISLRGPAIFRRLNELQVRYKTRFLFAGGCGKNLASSLVKRVWERHGPGTA
jgi:hypothetical protein